MRPEGMLTSPSAVKPVVKQEKPSAIASVATGITDLAARCMPLYVLGVVKNVKCPSSLERAGQYIAVSATTRPDWAVVNNLNLGR